MLNFARTRETFMSNLEFQNSPKGILDMAYIFKLIFTEFTLLPVTDTNRYTEQY
jgi:hypothetical protein